MTPLRFGRPFMLVAAAALVLAACDASEQNIEWTTGNSLGVMGPITAGGANVDYSTAAGAQIYLPVDANRLSQTDTTVYFYIRNFRPDWTYTWAAQGTNHEAIQDNEFLRVRFGQSTPVGTYTVEARRGEVTGTRTVQVLNPNLDIQIPRFTVFRTLNTALTRAGLLSALAADGPFTVFAPTNAGFLAALDADGDGELDDDEIPEAEVLADILRLHVVPGIIRAGNITDGQTATTLAGEQIVFRVQGGTVRVELPGGTSATVVQPFDVVVGNGVIHAIDNVLLFPEDDDA